MEGGSHLNRENRKDLIEIIGLIAIVGSLAFLIAEIRQNTTALEAGAWQDRSEALIQMSMKVAETDTLARISATYRKRADNCKETDIVCDQVIDIEYVESLTPTEFQQYRSFLTAHAFRLQNLNRQYQYGLLTEGYHQTGVVRIVELYVPRWRAFDVPQGLNLARRLGVLEDTQ